MKDIVTRHEDLNSDMWNYEVEIQMSNQNKLDSIFFTSAEDCKKSEIISIPFISRNKLYSCEDSSENIIDIHPDKHQGQKIRRIKELLRKR